MQVLQNSFFANWDLQKKESMMLAKLLELVLGPEPQPLLIAKSKSVLLWYAGSAQSFM